MSSSSHPVWVPWVGDARRGDAAAKEELSTYFTPFVHGILIAQLAHHVANEQTRLALEDALRRLPEMKESAAFGPWLLEAARKRAVVVAKSPGSTLEMLGGGPAATEGKKVLSRIRRMAEPTRERLVFRLLEGVPGPEIAEVTQAAEAQVRDDLERGFNTLLKELGQLGATSSDSYLWSMVGSPHPAIVPLENQLTPLRYDGSQPEGFATEAVGVRANPPDLGKNEGRRQTSPEQKRVVLPGPGETMVGDELETGIVQANKEEELVTSPGGKPPVHEAFETPLTDEQTSVLAAPAPASAAGGQERTRMATDLPVAAQQNPFEQQPGTIPVNDLPAAAGVERSSKPKRTLSSVQESSDSLGHALPAPTIVRARTSDVAKQKATGERHHSTSLGRPLPPSVMLEAPSITPTPSSDQDWRTSVMDVRPAQAQAKPEPFSITRGWTPFTLAVVFFVFFSLIAWVNIRGSEQAAKKGWTLVPVTVASQALPEGAVIDFDMISTRNVPVEFATSSVVKPDSAAYVVNQRIMVPVQAGDPLLWSEFETSRAGERLSHRVPIRARAYTLVTGNITSVGGWVRPGDHVDVIVTVRDDLAKVKTTSTTLQNLIILATGKMTANTNMGLLRPGQQEYGEVSLLALPQEIEILALMRERAQYQMVLRNDEDYDTLEAGRTTMDTLLKGDRVSVLQKKRFQTIQMIRQAKPAEPAPNR